MGRHTAHSITTLLPKNRLVSILVIELLNLAVYCPFQLFGTLFPCRNFNTVIDGLISVDARWIWIYMGGHLFWLASFCVLAKEENWYQIFTAEITAKLVCAVCFLLIPTTMVRPELPGTTISERFLNFVYRMDAPINLFPSIHCLESWICLRGIVGQKRIRPLWRFVAGGLALLICYSTLKTAQHVFADVVSGIVLAELMLRVFRHSSVPERVEVWLRNLLHESNENKKT